MALTSQDPLWRCRRRKFGSPAETAWDVAESDRGSPWSGGAISDK